MAITISSYNTLILAAVIMIIGHWLVFKIRFFAEYNIPEPVVGGLLAAVVVFALNSATGLVLNFNADLQSTCMLMFFASIGLSADFSRLKAGGKPLLIFLLVVVVFIFIQNVIGVLMAMGLGLQPLLGLVAGSISLTGGHGTAAAWGEVLENQYNVIGATTIGLALATFGLVIGGVIGGPVARYLLKKLKQQPSEVLNNQTSLQNISGEPRRPLVHDTSLEANNLTFDLYDQPRLINPYSAIQTLAMFAGCLAASDILVAVTNIELPQFIWALGTGVIIRNVLTYIFNFNMFDRAIDVFGSTALSLFLVMALLNLKLWEIAGLALPVLLILLVQTVVMIAYAAFITFKVMGSNYDASVLAAGHCGFGMGATPTAIANMQAITDRFGPSYKAYLIVPLVGAFFVDLVNAFTLQTFVSLPFLQ